jgi:YggT family protein
LNALLFLFKTFSDLYLLIFLLRFILQTVRADFYNPFSQFIVRATNPLVVPARRVLPSAGGFDLPTIIVLVLLQALVTFILLKIVGITPTVDVYLSYLVRRLISLTIWTYTICLFIYVILSWVAQANYSPIAVVLGHVVAPILRPVRRIVPLIGGLDLSPLIVLILLQAASIALNLPAYLR